VYVDVDGTIAGRNPYVFQKVCIRMFGLEIDPIPHLPYREFLQLPELLAYQQHIGEAEFKRQLVWADLDPESLIKSTVLPHAREGISQLSNIPASIGYCTGRYTASPEWFSRNEGMAEATKDWLDANNFVNPAEVIFCRDKLMTLWEQHEKEGLVVLIDDQYEKLLQRFALLEQKDSLKNWLRMHFILVAYGTEDFPPDSYGLGLRVFPLLSWKHVDVLFEYLQGLQ